MRLARAKVISYSFFTPFQFLHVIYSRYLQQGLAVKRLLDVRDEACRVNQLRSTREEAEALLRGVQHL